MPKELAIGQDTEVTYEGEGFEPTFQITYLIPPEGASELQPNPDIEVLDLQVLDSTTATATVRISAGAQVLTGAPVEWDQ